MRTLLTTSLVATFVMVIAIGCTQSTPAPEEGASGDATTTVTLANAMCPMEGVEVDEAVTVEWNGQTIGFCCEKCQAAWNDLSDEEKSAKMAALESEDTTG